MCRALRWLKQHFARVTHVSGAVVVAATRNNNNTIHYNATSQRQQQRLTMSSISSVLQNSCRSVYEQKNVNEKKLIRKIFYFKNTRTNFRCFCHQNISEFLDSAKKSQLFRRVFGSMHFHRRTDRCMNDALWWFKHTFLILVPLCSFNGCTRPCVLRITKSGNGNRNCTLKQEPCTQNRKIQDKKSIGSSSNNKANIPNSLTEWVSECVEISVIQKAYGDISTVFPYISSSLSLARSRWPLIFFLSAVSHLYTKKNRRESV